MEKKSGQGVRWSVIVGLVLLGWLSPVSAAQQTVAVCHRTGSGNFRLLNVPEQLVAVHLGHGDAFPGDAVPGNPDLVFDENCQQVSVSPGQCIEGADEITEQSDEAACVMHCNTAFAELSCQGGLQAPPDFTEPPEFGLPGLCRCFCFACP
jgi:hypothetical protein